MGQAHPATTGPPIGLDEIEAKNERTVARLEEAVQRVQHNPVAGPVIGLLVEARIGLADVPRLVAELRAAREVINHISVLLDTSPIGPTRADLATLAFQIRQVIDKARGGK